MGLDKRPHGMLMGLVKRPYEMHLGLAKRPYGMHLGLAKRPFWFFMALGKRACTVYFPLPKGLGVEMPTFFEWVENCWTGFGRGLFKKCCKHVLLCLKFKALT